MKSYKIKTLKDILEAVNDKNVDGFLLDFEQFLRVAVSAQALNNDIFKLDVDGIGFTWNDDGENGVVKKITVEIKNELSPQEVKGE